MCIFFFIQENIGNIEVWEQLSQEIEELKKVEETTRAQIEKYAEMDPDTINTLNNKAEVSYINNYNYFITIFMK